MRWMVVWVALLGCVAALADTPAQPDQAKLAKPEPEPAAAGMLALTPQQRVRRFVEASNAHDVDAMVAAVNADFRWLQVEGAQVVTEVVGAEQLRSWLEGYFHSTPSARSEVGAMLWDGGFLTAVETASWEDGDGRRQSQRSTSLYRFDATGRIEAVWYFPAQPTEQAVSQ